jgi:hypothetical protein
MEDYDNGSAVAAIFAFCRSTTNCRVYCAQSMQQQPASGKFQTDGEGVMARLFVSPVRGLVATSLFFLGLFAFGGSAANAAVATVSVQAIATLRFVSLSTEDDLDTHLTELPDGVEVFVDMIGGYTFARARGNATAGASGEPNVVAIDLGTIPTQEALAAYFEENFDFGLRVPIAPGGELDFYLEGSASAFSVNGSGGNGVFMGAGFLSVNHRVTDGGQYRVNFRISDALSGDSSAVGESASAGFDTRVVPVGFGPAERAILHSRSFNDSGSTGGAFTYFVEASNHVSLGSGVVLSIAGFARVPEPAPATLLLPALVAVALVRFGSRKQNLN